MAYQSIFAIRSSARSSDQQGSTSRRFPRRIWTLDSVRDRFWLSCIGAPGQSRGRGKIIRSAERGCPEFVDPATIADLTSLGFTVVRFLPVCLFDEQRLKRRRKRRTRDRIGTQWSVAHPSSAFNVATLPRFHCRWSSSLLSFWLWGHVMKVKSTGTNS